MPFKIHFTAASLMCTDTNISKGILFSGRKPMAVGKLSLDLIHIMAEKSIIQKT